MVDASVVAKWYLEERLSSEAVAILEAGMRGGDRLLAPILLHAELGNILWYRRGELYEGEVRAVCSAFQSAPLLFTELEPPMPLALEVSLAHGCAVYDALYVALAQAETATFVTADRKLVRSLSGTPLESRVSELGPGELVPE